MELLDPMATFALGAAVLLLLSWLALRLSQRGGWRRPPPRRDALDTVTAWPPEASRVLSINERQAYELLRRSLPGFMVLAQVPLSRFIRVPTRHSYTDWMQRVGNLSADLLLCDSGSRVMAVVDIRSPHETERSRRRHERLTRVLEASGVRVYSWREGALPTAAEIRTVIGTALKPAAGMVKPTASRPMPLIPVAEIEEILHDGDLSAQEQDAMEPVPSAFFEDMDSERGQLSRA